MELNKKRLFGMLLLSLMITWIIPVFVRAASKFPTTEKLTKAFEKFTNQPGKVLRVKESAIPGLFEAIFLVNGKKSILYVDQEAKYFIVGQLIKIASGNNLTHQAMIDFDRFSPEEMDKIEQLSAFKLGDSGKTLYFVTDPECPYCKRGESILKMLAKEGIITVKFLFFPQKFHKGAEQESVSIVCDNKGFEGLERNYKSKNQCKDGIRKVRNSVNFLREKGINETPVYIFPDGRYYSGLLSDESLLIKLGIIHSSKSSNGDDETETQKKLVSVHP